MKISVCIPTFNQSAYIEKAILSAWQQSITPFEIIVYDDCSTDETPHVLHNLSLQIPVLKYFRQAENQGISKNTDRCLRSATGDFIVRLDSDDYLHPKYIEKLAGLLNDHKDAGYAHCAVQEIDQNNKLLKERLLFRKDVYQSAGEALKAAAQGYRVAANIIMFRKEALIRAEYLAGRSNFAEDYHLTATISSLGFGNAYHNEVLAYYRVWIDEGKV